MATTELKLLGAKLSVYSCRVEWALKMKGIDYEFVEEDMSNKSPLLLKSNPVHKKVPVLIHAGKSIPESLIILEYIDETWKENPIMPEDPYERAQARFWATFAEEKFQGEIINAFAMEGEEKAKAIESAVEALKVLEEEFKGRKFFGGERIGFVDIVVGWIALWLGVVEEIINFKVLDSNKFPWLDSWMKDFLEVPIIKKNLPPRDKLMNTFQNLRKAVLALNITTK